MAKQVLPVNFKDDVLADSMGGKRRYILTENADGTFTLDDATTYTQVGDVFGAARLNAICKAVNESVDQAKVVDDVDDIKAITQPGYVPGTLPLKQVIRDLNNINVYVGSDGKLHYVNKDGADSVLPFSSVSDSWSLNLPADADMFYITVPIPSKDYKYCDYNLGYYDIGNFYGIKHDGTEVVIASATAGVVSGKVNISNYKGIKFMKRKLTQTITFRK